MEIPGITLTGEVQSLITDLVNIDTRQRAEKVKLFLRLFELWKVDLEQGITSTNKFEENRLYIRRIMLESYNEIERNAEKFTMFLKVEAHMSPKIMKLFQVILPKSSNFRIDMK